MKAKIVLESDGSVTLYRDGDCFIDERVSINYFVPLQGGYVRAFGINGRHSQVCDKLSYRGNALISTHENLLSLIRSEWRKSTINCRH